jgi:hypothetical protein
MESLPELLNSTWWYYAQSIFTIAMLIHAYRAGAEWFWFLIIFFVQPIGAWAYFILVFLRGFRIGDSGGWQWQRKLSLDELRYHAERMPTVNTRLALAQGLMAKSRHAEAIPILEAILATDQIHCQAMHDLALCHLACAQPKEAVAMLQRLMQRDSRWAYYKAWRTLIEAHVACANPAEALKACRELAKMVPTLENQCLLAEHLLENNLHAEAADILMQALEDLSFAPLGKRLKNWGWARHARKLLSEAETGPVN